MGGTFARTRTVFAVTIINLNSINLTVGVGFAFARATCAIFFAVSRGGDGFDCLVSQTIDMCFNGICTFLGQILVCFCPPQRIGVSVNGDFAILIVCFGQAVNKCA